MATIITPEAIISYPHLFEPQTPPGGSEPVYSCALIFEEDTDISELTRAADEAALAKFGAKWGEKNLRMPFRDDGPSKGYPTASVFINVKSRVAPGVVDRYPGRDGRPMPITDPSEIYPGCIVRASLQPFAYDTAGNRGVSFALNNVQKLGEGDRMDGRKTAADEFEATDTAPTELSEMLS